MPIVQNFLCFDLETGGYSIGTFELFLQGCLLAFAGFRLTHSLAHNDRESDFIVRHKLKLLRILMTFSCYNNFDRGNGDLQLKFDIFSLLDFWNIKGKKFIYATSFDSYFFIHFRKTFASFFHTCSRQFSCYSRSC